MIIGRLGKIASRSYAGPQAITINEDLAIGQVIGDRRQTGTSPSHRSEEGLAGVDNDPFLRLQILAGKVEPFFEFRRKASLDLYRSRLFAWSSQQEIDFGSSRCAVEVGCSAVRRGRDQCFGHEALPTGADNWMTK